MTSHEILKSSMLDILFENRNKQYGAYALRKFYANRMGVALAISFSSVLLLVFLIPFSSSSSEVTSLPEDNTVIVRAIEIPQPEELPPPAQVEPPKVQQRAVVDYQTPVIVPDVDVDQTIPTVD